MRFWQEPQKIAGVSVTTASFDKLQQLLQSPSISDSQRVQIVVTRPDFHAWHKSRTRERLRTLGG